MIPDLAHLISMVTLDGDIITLCHSLLDTGDSMGMQRYVTKENGSIVSLTLEVSLPRPKCQMGVCKIISCRNNGQSHCDITLEMINYDSYRYMDWCIRVSPVLLKLMTEVNEGMHRGEFCTFKILIVRGRGAVVIPLTINGVQCR